MRNRKWFPMQDGPPIPWSFAEAIFEMYHELFRSQSLQEIVNRGGFGYIEIPYFAKQLRKADECEEAAWKAMFSSQEETKEQ